jgi:hypothetical protein
VSPAASSALSSWRPSRYSADRYATTLACARICVLTVSNHRDISCCRTVRANAMYRSFGVARASVTP